MTTSKRPTLAKRTQPSAKRKPKSELALSGAPRANKQATKQHVSCRKGAALRARVEPSGPFEVGEVIGGAYRILGTIGFGGYGVVYEADDTALGRRVAIKASTESDVELRAEAEATSAFHHPGVTMVYGAGKHRGHSYIAMERLQGRTLLSHVQTTARDGNDVPVLEAIELLTTVAQTLAVVHAAGLVHRDVKPGNVMLVPDGRVVLMDFGLFLPRAGVEQQPQGTAEYMAPETLRGIPACPSADIYSLGVTAYELLTGEVPYSRVDMFAMLNHEREFKAEPVRHSRPDVPAALADLIHEMIDRDPGCRPEADGVVYRLGRLKQSILERAATGLQLMIVDDDPSVNQLLTTWLAARMPGARIRSIRNADEALAYIRMAPPDVLLLDLNMPGTSGVELCMLLRGMHLARDCMIVAVSAAAQEYDQKLLQTLGVSRFVAKGSGMLESVLADIREQAELVRRTNRGA